VKDVPDPEGEDVKAFALKVKLAGDPGDANAETWVEKASVGTIGSLDGEWSTRRRYDPGNSEWILGTATVKKVGEWVYILVTDSGSIWLIEAKLQGKSRLVGRSICLGDSDSSPWLGEIVNDERIDGQWTSGRWDLRRKIAHK
jgi:hypothetical protein